MELKKIRNLFIARICMWIVALGATIYWIYWNFKLYSLKVFDVHAFATVFRPKFYTALVITIVAICISFYLRRISDRIKNKLKFHVPDDEEENQDK